MKILSFDVGIKNLAYCVLNNDKIEKWSVLNITSNSKENNCTKLVQTLDACDDILNSDIVLIEKQPSKNNKMRIIEGLLNAYFVIKGITNEQSAINEVKVYSAKHKLGNDTFKGKANYSQRKKLSVFRCGCFLKQTNQSDIIVDIFDKSNKKDDLADCLLQALSFTNFQITEGTLDFKLSEKIVARKPTKKQERTRYSKCNLKWFFNEFKNISQDKNDILFKLSSNVKIQSAIKYWFKTNEEAYDILGR